MMVIKKQNQKTRPALSLAMNFRYGNEYQSDLEVKIIQLIIAYQIANADSMELV